MRAFCSHIKALSKIFYTSAHQPPWLLLIQFLTPPEQPDKTCSYTRPAAKAASNRLVFRHHSAFPHTYIDPNLLHHHTHQSPCEFRMVTFSTPRTAKQVVVRKQEQLGKMRFYTWFATEAASDERVLGVQRRRDIHNIRTRFRGGSHVHVGYSGTHLWVFGV
jgi:hypothetical protein